MIETPTRPGAPVAPPPDPRRREPDPPPEPSSRYEHACADCGAPLHRDQAACLNCGAMVDDSSGGAGIRRAAVGSVTALLVLGGAVGAAVAGLPNGKHIPKAATTQVLVKPKPPPQATAGTNGTGAKPIAPLPGGGNTAKPPPLAPVKPHRAKAKTAGKSNGAKNGGSNSGSGSSGGSPSGNGSKNNNNNNKGNPKGNGKGKGKGHHNPPLALFTTGEAPSDAGQFSTASGPSANPGSADNTIDSDVHSAWTTSSAGRGVYVQPSHTGYHQIGVVSSTPGYDVKVYYTTAGSPPANILDWHQVGQSTNASSKQAFDLGGGARHASYLLVLIDALAPGSSPHVSLNEIQLLP